jgi:hypothetical protein
MMIYKCCHKECNFTPTICKVCFLIHMQTTPFYKTDTDSIIPHRQYAFHQQYLNDKHHDKCLNKNITHPIINHITNKII